MKAGAEAKPRRCRGGGSEREEMGLRFCLHFFPRLLAAPWALEGPPGCLGGHILLQPRAMRAWGGSRDGGGGSVSSSISLGCFSAPVPAPAWLLAGLEEALPQPSCVGRGRIQGRGRRGVGRRCLVRLQGPRLLPSISFWWLGAQTDPRLLLLGSLPEAVGPGAGGLAWGEQSKHRARGAGGGLRVSAQGSLRDGGPRAVAVPPSR